MLIKKWNNYLMNLHNNKNTYNGVEYAAYDKEYSDEALDNREYDK